MSRLEIKQIIDFLFWKRTWFRSSLIIAPLVLTVPNYLGLIHLLDNIAGIWYLIYLMVIAIACYDNKNVDNILKPDSLKKRIKQKSVKKNIIESNTIEF